MASDNPILNLREIAEDLTRSNNNVNDSKYLKTISNSLTHLNLENLTRYEERILTENLLILLNYSLNYRYGSYAKTINIDPVFVNQVEKGKSKVKKKNSENLSSARQNMTEIIDNVSNSRKRGSIRHIPSNAKILEPIRNLIHFVDITDMGKMKMAI